MCKALWSLNFLQSHKRDASYCTDSYKREHVVDTPSVVIRTKKFKQKHSFEFGQVTYLQFQNLIWMITDTHINSLWYWIFAVHKITLLKAWLIGTLIRSPLVNLFLYYFQTRFALLIGYSNAICFARILWSPADKIKEY